MDVRSLSVEGADTVGLGGAGKPFCVCSAEGMCDYHAATLPRPIVRRFMQTEESERIVNEVVSRTALSCVTDEVRSVFLGPESGPHGASTR